MNQSLILSFTWVDILKTTLEAKHYEKNQLKNCVPFDCCCALSKQSEAKCLHCLIVNSAILCTDS